MGNSFFSLLRGATWYYNAITILFIYFASFIGYEDDILKDISNLHVQGAKFGRKKDKKGRKKDKFGGNTFFKLSSAEFMEFCFFSKSEFRPMDFL